MSVKTDKIKCSSCGISVPDVPEDATGDELLCNACHEKREAFLAVRTARENRIREEGFTPEACPFCLCLSLYPLTKESAALNSVSRQDNKTYICSPCGMDEALHDYAKAEARKKDK